MDYWKSTRHVVLAIAITAALVFLNGCQFRTSSTIGSTIRPKQETTPPIPTASARDSPQAACANGSGTKFTSPQAYQAVPLGENIQIAGCVSGENISRAEIEIDGRVYATLAFRKPVQAFTALRIEVLKPYLSWTATKSGLHIFRINVFGLGNDKLLSKSDPVVVIAATSEQLSHAGTFGPPPLPACPDKPVTIIYSPQTSNLVELGQVTYISGCIKGDAITRVDIQIDGAFFATLPEPNLTYGERDVPNGRAFGVPWMPTISGTHTINLLIYKGKDELPEATDLISVRAEQPLESAPAPPAPTSK